jgi:hypothetical protein
MPEGSIYITKLSSHPELYAVAFVPLRGPRRAAAPGPFSSRVIAHQGVCSCGATHDECAIPVT